VRSPASHRIESAAQTETARALAISSPFLDSNCEILQRWLRLDNKFHGHLFVILAADDRTDDDISIGFGRCRQMEFLGARLEQQVPALDRRTILSSQQGKAVDRAVAIAAFGFLGGNAEDDFFSE
jgi:hypothetical protein